MADVIQNYEVQKGRTVTCKMGVAHAGEKGISLGSFSGNDNTEKQNMIDKFVKDGILKAVPLKKESLALDEERERERLEKEMAEERSTAILEADFDEMKKDPMIKFAEKWEIELKANLADEIREELKALQASLTAPE